MQLRKIHGAFDYCLGILLIVLPYVTGMKPGGGARQTMLWVGAIILAYSLCTRYPYGVSKFINFRVHLTLDYLTGIFLLISPWLAAFAPSVWVPHVALGAIQLIVALVTQTQLVDATSR